MCYGDFMRKYIVTFIEDNKQSIITLGACIIIGLVVGIILYFFIDNNTKIQMTDNIQKTFDLSKDKNFENINIIKNGIVTNFVTIIVIIISTLTIIAPVVVCAIYFLKGFSLGLYICVLFSILNAGSGMIATFVYVLIPNLFLLPILVYIGTNAINFHYEVTGKDEGKLKLTSFIKFMYQILLGLPFIFLSIILEQLMSGLVIYLYTKV
jgi:uncharacterized membrane protein SpoIIM required for sporulation